MKLPELPGDDQRIPSSFDVRRETALRRYFYERNVDPLTGPEISWQWLDIPLLLLVDLL